MTRAKQQFDFSVAAGQVAAIANMFRGPHAIKVRAHDLMPPELRDLDAARPGRSVSDATEPPFAGVGGKFKPIHALKALLPKQ